MRPPAVEREQSGAGRLSPSLRAPPAARTSSPSLLRPGSPSAAARRERPSGCTSIKTQRLASGVLRRGKEVSDGKRVVVNQRPLSRGAARARKTAAEALAARNTADAAAQDAQAVQQAQEAPPQPTVRDCDGKDVPRDRVLRDLLEALRNQKLAKFQGWQRSVGQLRACLNVDLVASGLAAELELRPHFGVRVLGEGEATRFSLAPKNNIDCREALEERALASQLVSVERRGPFLKPVAPGESLRAASKRYVARGPVALSELVQGTYEHALPHMQTLKRKAGLLEVTVVVRRRCINSPTASVIYRPADLPELTEDHRDLSTAVARRSFSADVQDKVLAFAVPQAGNTLGSVLVNDPLNLTSQVYQQRSELLKNFPGPEPTSPEAEALLRTSVDLFENRAQIVGKLWASSLYPAEEQLVFDALCASPLIDRSARSFREAPCHEALTGASGLTPLQTGRALQTLVRDRLVVCIQHKGICCYGIDYAAMLFAIKYRADCAQGLQKPVVPPAATQSSEDEAQAAEPRFSPLTGFACINRYCLEEHPTPFEDDCEICSSCGASLLQKGPADLEAACLQRQKFVSREDLGAALPRLASLLDELRSDLSRSRVRLRRFSTESEQTDEFLSELDAVVAQVRGLAVALSASGQRASLAKKAEAVAARAAAAAAEARKANERLGQCSAAHKQLDDEKKRRLEAAAQRPSHKATVRGDVPKALQEQLDRSKAALSDAKSESTRTRALAKKCALQAKLVVQEAEALGEEDRRAQEADQAALAAELQEMLDDLPAEAAAADAAAIDALEAGFAGLEEEDFGGQPGEAVVAGAVLGSCGNDLFGDFDLFGEDDDDAWE